MEEKGIHLNNIVHNYENLEEDIIKQLTFKWKHGTTIGSNRENIWKELFERIVPKKFRVERNVFIIDSKGNCSSEIDLAIFDEQYTPYIFNHGVLKFIPVEAVAAVIECKSNIPDNDRVKGWLKNINTLTTAQNSIVRIAGRVLYGSEEIGDIKGPYLNTQTATRPIKILCYISSTKESGCKLKKGFDIVLEANDNKGKLEIIFNEEFKNLYDWYMELNHTDDNKEKIENFFKESEKNNENYHKKPIADIKKLQDYQLEQLEVKLSKAKKTTLLSFIFQFNQLLMLINNPIFFPHMAYVEMFNSHLDRE